MGHMRVLKGEDSLPMYSLSLDYSWMLWLLLLTISSQTKNDGLGRPS